MSGTISLGDLRHWERELDQVAQRFGPLLGRVEMQAQGARYLRGLIAQVDRKNGWQLAQHLGELTPINLQHFIARAAWSADSVRDERCKHVELALEAVGLSDRADHYPRQLSGGQEQRVGIARAIVAHPKVVVADEPTGSLDAETSQQIQVLLERLNQELGITMLMVTHDHDVAGIASRQLRLDRGRIVETRTSHSGQATRVTAER